MDKHYDPKSVENKWYAWWEQNGLFHDEAARGGTPYSVVIPPPNVTGILHMGHALNNTIQDVLVRWRRMQGRNTVWMPGTDHAGIATQNVVEKALRKEGLSRRDLGREAFLARVWEWRKEYGGTIVRQLRQLGASCDWSRERFTMDEGLSAAVAEVFCRLYDEGLIYRGNYIVNWCPRCHTALSDEESEHQDTQGHLWHIRYPIPGGGEVVVATTRPETMLGDTAVAVNPADERYQDLIGKSVTLPLMNREIPVVADDYVDRAFGTGVVKITPAHDPNDFQVALRHNLPMLNVMNGDGTMNEEAGPYAGMDRFACRKQVIADLEAQGLLVKTDPHQHAVGHCYRCDTVVEPRLSKQWFVCMKPLAEPAIEAVRTGKIVFVPQRWEKTYFEWMENIRDWCISRQIWWGHRIPVYTCTPCGHEWAAKTAPNTCPKCGAAADQITQDEDVLDTWFSSWLWPFSTFGWPADHPDLKFYYPTTDLTTAPDILFFWVARMIMAGYEYMGDLPFRNVYFTGIIRDKQGRKMSKSLGNSPDPLALIARYGADALRFGTMRSAPLGQDVLFDEKDVELGRNFCNKLWNACRFRQMQGGAIEDEIDPALLTSDDKWILRRLDRAIREIDDAFAGYRFNEATATLYRFFWSEYCDWYVEASKAALQSGRSDNPSDPPGARAPDPDAAAAARRRANTLAVIDFVLSHTLRLFHPFLPFITEELWHGMNYHADLPIDQGGHTIMDARWPKPLDPAFCEHYGLDETAEQVASAKYELVGVGRNFRREFNLASNRKLQFVLKPAGDLPPAEVEVIRLLLNAETIEVHRAYTPPKGTPMAANALGELYLPLAGLIDSAAERARLEKELEKARLEVGKVAAKLGNPQFTQRVPPAVLEEHTKRLADWQAKEKQILTSLNNLPE